MNRDLRDAREFTEKGVRWAIAEPFTVDRLKHCRKDKCIKD